MNHEEPGLAPEDDPDGEFNAVDVRTIYAVFIDRYEYLDMVLRSLPTPRSRDEAMEEKTRVEAIIKKLCRPSILPFI